MPQLQVNGTELFYEDAGPRDAPALVLSHSLFFTSQMFAHQAKRFAGEYRVVRYDHRGQGKSARDEVARLDMDTLTDDAAALIEALQLGPCHFAGNSMGGFVALRLAARRPDLLASCTVLGSSGEEEHKRVDFAPLVAQMQAAGTAQVIDTLMFIMFGDTFLTDPARAEERDAYRAAMLGLDRSIGDCALQVIDRNLVLPELKNCSVPVMVVAGGEDHTYSVALSQHIVDAAPHGHLKLVARGGHSVSLEEPAEVNELLARHMKLARTTATA